jgi:Bacterial toxin homologue of phage lysozyme, C-term
MLVNWSFISQLEGGRRLMGYVSCPESGEKGVTIATGIDLGNYSSSAIDAMAVSDELKTKLKRYAGLKGEAAATALDGQPLGLTSAEAEALDEAAKKPIVQQLAASYDAAVLDKEGLVPFKMLPEAAQTVIASVALKYGPDLPARFPRFWQCVCAQDWPAAVAELEQCESAHRARHKHEADLLKTVYQ